jgi:3-oxo-5-alpha-steroid 4-dehydrogenase 3
LAYGSRALQPTSKDGVDVSQSVSKRPVDHGYGKGVDSLLDHLATYQVPHGYFTQFYVVSVVSSVFWLVQILMNGRVFTTIVSLKSSADDAPSMSSAKLALTWSLMTAQVIRRLYESITLAKPSQAQMWVGHWLVGIAFYLAMSVAVWVEGIRALLLGF